MDKYWIVTGDNGCRQHVHANTPEEALRAATAIPIESARAHEAEYQDGKETINPVGYVWRNGGVVPLLPRDGSMSDPRWSDEERETRDFSAPIRPGSAVLLVGYGLSRAMTNHYLRRFPRAERWTLNADRIPGAKTHFQIHREDVCTNMEQKQFEMDDLVKSGVRIITPDNFPFDKMRRQFWTSTVDYMLALADLEGFEHVCMPGLDFGGIRRMQEIIGAAYWIGALEGKGAKVYRSPQSLVFRHIKYGFCTEREHRDYERYPETIIEEEHHGGH